MLIGYNFDPYLTQNPFFNCRPIRHAFHTVYIEAIDDWLEFRSLLDTESFFITVGL
jgi:hypothetical protein